ncbi:MAG: methionine synthase [Elusimicrobia bacterium]|nr:methionine synthase [Elusimicrobiota bacterium]
MGTAIQAKDLSAADFGGAKLEGCNENLVLTRPDVVSEIHESYLEAGSDILETNTFGAIRHVLAEYDLEDSILEINRRAAELARDAARRHSTAQKPRFVAGALGPGTKTISVTGGITFEEVREAYAEASLGLLEGGVDLFLIETQQDTLNIKASLLGILDTFQSMERSVPILLSASIETMGTMLGGQTAEALCDSVAHFPLLALGLNCATGPDFMTDHIRTIAQSSSFHTLCYPNAGLPDENGHYNETPEMVAKKLDRFCAAGWINIVGGCCGTTPRHVRLLAQMAEARRPRALPKIRRSTVSGLESLRLDEDRRPVLVGERANVIGSRLFKELIVKESHEEASEIGRRQVRNGAHILDVCLANPDRDEQSDMIRFLDFLTKKVKVPLMIDSTDAAVIEEALKRCPGKSIVNSINLEDGEERFEKVVPLLRQYGAAVVVGTIDEDKAQGMALTSRRKLEIALRSHELLTRKYGLASEDLIFDPLVFPSGTGDKNYWGSAMETVEGLKLIKKALPSCKTILGVSNVSFGLPAPGREILNSVFLHLCVEAGLDLAIVNSEKIARYSSIPETEKKLCLYLLSWKGPMDPSRPQGYDAVAEFSAHFRQAVAQKKTESERLKLPIDERLARNVVEGSKEGLLLDLEALLKERKPLEIINGPLMKGMDEVGRLFAANDMIVAEVLQSAEVMKAAVSFLEPHMDKADAASRGTVLLATVKGDVHDIGKNLVHIILKNNGYRVEDLGIKVAPETLIEAIKRISPHIVGLSGLLVKSAQQMSVTAEDLANAGVKIPILVGGAALSAKFTAAKIAPRYPGAVLYAKDAMTGLEYSNQLQDQKRRSALLKKNKEIQDHLAAPVRPNASPNGPESGAAAAAAPIIGQDHNIPLPPDLKPHVLPDFSVEEIFGYINPIMLYGKHLGLKGSPERLFQESNLKALELRRQVLDLQSEILAKGLIKAKAVYRFYPAQAEGNKVLLYRSPLETAPLEAFEFPRQDSGDKLCLADYVRPKSASKDFIALFVVTCGSGVRELSDCYREKGEYFKSHALQAIAIEAAEGFAELLHERLRAMWGFADAPSLTLKDKFQARYRGLRVSFGYPACPSLEDQEKLFHLLEPEKNIGVSLTEGFMMEPEASVSALVFHHPQARYFSVLNSVTA